MKKIILGFRHSKAFKIFSVKQEDGMHIPSVSGNRFVERMTTGVGNISNKKNAMSYFYTINQIHLSVDYFSKRTEEAFLAIRKGDFSSIAVPYFSRGRSYNHIAIPKENEENIFRNINDYEYAYIFNADKIAVEFYGRGFDFIEELDSDIPMPYYASINIRTAYISSKLQKEFNVLPFLERNHEQEVLLKHYPIEEKK